MGDLGRQRSRLEVSLGASLLAPPLPQSGASGGVRGSGGGQGMGWWGAFLEDPETSWVIKLRWNDLVSWESALKGCLKGVIRAGAL